MDSKQRSQALLLPIPAKNKAGRPLAATRWARLQRRKFTVCCLFDTHTCISYMLFVVMLHGKYCTHWQLYDYFTQHFASYGGEKRRARDGNKTLLLPIKPQWNLTTLRFTIDGVMAPIVQTEEKHYIFVVYTDCLRNVRDTGYGNGSGWPARVCRLEIKKTRRWQCERGI